MQVYASTVINCQANSVWQVLRDFVGLTAWSNVVASAEIVNGHAPDQPGAIRRLTLNDGVTFVETLVSLSDRERKLEYDILEGPLPVTDYIATMQVTPVTFDDSAFVAWSATFDATPDVAAEMRDVVGNQICAGGLAALKASLEKR